MGRKLADYRVFGEYELPRKRSPKGLVLDTSKEVLQEFWQELEDECEGLASAVGCYLFGVKSGPRITPWYIGQAKKGFKSECLTPHKRDKYREVVANTAKGTPQLIFIARMTDGGKFSSALGVSEARFVERHLIQWALLRNSKIINVASTKHLREVCIPGILNPGKGKPSKGATLLRETLVPSWLS